MFALTGGSGSGKTTVAELWREAGVTVLDCDRVARDVVDLPPCRKALCDAFGQDIYTHNGLNRKELARRAFVSKETAQLLTNATHPFIVEQLLQESEEAAKNGAKFVVADGSTIIGGPFEKYCSLFFVMHADENDKIARIMQRDGISEDAARARIAAQISQEELLAKADFVIENFTTLEKLKENARLALAQMAGWCDDQAN